MLSINYTETMRYLGIDYGTKRIGIALSDERGSIAFAHSVIPHDGSTLSVILELIHKEAVAGVVIGESVHLDGSANLLMKKITEFKEALEKEIDIPIFLEKEWMSSVAARAHMYGKGNIANEQWTGSANAKKKSAIDDHAAAVILQRFLEKRRAQ